MKKKRLLTILLALFSVFLLAFSTHMSSRIQVTRSVNTFSAILKTLDQLYVDSLNFQHLSQVAIKAMLKEVDPYTEYYSEEDLQKASLVTRGEYAGIGALLQERDSAIVVRHLYEESPAAMAGLKVADVITALDGKSITNWSIEKVTDYLKGKPGEKVTLEIKRPGTKMPITLELERQIVKMPIVPYYGIAEPGVGYIKLASFTSEETADTFKVALEDLLAQNTQSLIIDLRNNGGGRMDHAIRICSYFLPERSLIVTMKGKQPENVREFYTSTPPLVPSDMPIVVLVNHSTASASEIVAGALQDYDRAVILGERTFGKGLVQTVANMPYKAQMKYTNAKYYIPSGRCVQTYNYDHSQSELVTTTTPDSLLKPFKTQAGRVVYEGSGIIPDKEALFVLEIPESIAEMERQNVFFDFATEYTLRQRSTPSIDDFEITKKDIADFETFVMKSSFMYENGSQKQLNALIAQSKVDGVYDQNKTALEQLRSRLATNLHEDIVNNQSALKQRLANEVLSRYYGLADMTRYQLKSDKQYEAALQLISDKEAYHQTITASIVR